MVQGAFGGRPAPPLPLPLPSPSASTSGAAAPASASTLALLSPQTSALLAGGAALGGGAAAGGAAGGVGSNPHGPERAQCTLLAAWLTELHLDAINRALLEVGEGGL